MRVQEVAGGNIKEINGNYALVVEGGDDFSLRDFCYFRIWNLKTGKEVTKERAFAYDTPNFVTSPRGVLYVRSDFFDNIPMETISHFYDLNGAEIGEIKGGSPKFIGNEVVEAEYRQRLVNFDNERMHFYQILDLKTGRVTERQEAK